MAAPPKSLVRGDIWCFLVLLSCFSAPLAFPQFPVFYESGSHLLPTVCHTQILVTPLSKLARERSGRNFPPGVVISVSWICRCCSHNFSEFCVFYGKIFFHLRNIHVCCSPRGAPTPTTLLFCSALISSVSRVNILFKLFIFRVE